MKPVHGGNVRAFAKQFGFREDEILDFSSNTNPLGPPDSVREFYRHSFEKILHYPDPDSGQLRKEIARHFPIFPENVMIGNGSTELIHLIVQLLRPKVALLVEPNFLEYRYALNIHRVEVRGLLLKEKDGFQVSFPELLNAAQGIELLFLSNPNNPTGGAIPRGQLLEFLGELKRRRVFVVIDEAYVDWIPETSLASSITDNVNFFVIRCLTKFFTIPGIRIGYGLGPRRLVESLRRVQVSWSVNALAEAVAIEALRDMEFTEASRKFMQAEKEYFEKALGEVEALRLFPSAANFYLAKLKGSVRVSELFSHLAAAKILIRDCSNFVGLDNQFFRAAVRARPDNELLIRHMKEAFSEKGVPVD